MDTSSVKKNIGWILFLAIMGFASVLRLVCLDSIPGGIHQDEAITAWNAFSMYNYGFDSAGHKWPVYIADWGDGHSAMYCWLLLPIFWITGAGLVPALTRLPQAIMGILTVAALYGCLKQIWNEKFALWGAFLLAVCPWHITMCRWGLDANLLPAFLTFSLYFFLKGVEKQKYLLVAAVFYGLTLYTYAVSWPCVVVILACQILYCLVTKRLSINRYSVSATVILAVIAMPLLLFVGVNSGIIPEIHLPFMTIPAMSGYRASEFGISFSEMITNIKNVFGLLVYNNVGLPYDYVEPSGLFYDIGNIFIIIGCFVLLKRLWDGRRAKGNDIFVIFQLIGAAVVCLTIEARVNRINALFIPMLIIEAYGVFGMLHFVKEKFTGMKVYKALGVCIFAGFCVYFGQFWFHYTTDYKELASLYYAEGLVQALDDACEVAEEKRGEDFSIVFDRGAQWTRVLYATEVDGAEYLDSVVYKENGIEPFSYTNKGISFYNGIDYEQIDENNIYIFYGYDLELFSKNFQVVQYNDWYLAYNK